MTGSGTALDPYVIWDVNDLQDMANGAPYASNVYYELGCNIDATPTAGWNWDAVRGVFQGFLPRSFTGQLDGNRHTIDGLYINRESTGGQYLGLVGAFGWAAGPARIQYVRLTNINYYGRGNGEHSWVNIGGIAGGTNGGTIYRCYVRSGSIVGRNDRWGLPGTQAANSGGILGGFSEGGVVEQCYSNVSVHANHSSRSDSRAGGLVGMMWRDGQIRNCFARGPVAATDLAGGALGYQWDVQGRVTNVYATGSVVGARPGGLIGFRDFGAVAPTASFWDMEASGIGISDGGTGLTTAQAKTEATYTAAGWDFATIWTLDDPYVYWNDGYPFFQDDPVPTIAVVSPNGGEDWVAGSTYNILWTHTGDPGTHVQIELFEAGAFDETIIASRVIGPVGGGTYSWTIDSGKTPSTQYRVKITSTSAPYTDTSDNDFRIRGTPVPPPAPTVATLPATGVG